MATYTVFIVTRNARHHYPVIMANNGKAILNEPVKRAQDLERSVNRFLNGALLNGALWNSKDIPVIRITEKAFKAKFPKYAANKGPKKKAVKPSVFDVGATVYINAGSWGTVVGRIIRKSEFSGAWQCVITKGKHKGDTGSWMSDDMTLKPAPAKRITKTVTNPVK